MKLTYRSPGGQLKNFHGNALYRGRLYVVCYMGHTRHGHRARLEFLDGTQTFWVPVSELSQIRDLGQSPVCVDDGAELPPESERPF